MKASTVGRRLLAEGCSPHTFAVNRRVSDAYCLVESGGTWNVFYTERGIDSPPIFSSRSEDEACRFFFDHIMKQQHWHIVGFFKDQAAAQALEAKLNAAGIRPIRNDIPAYRAPDDPRYRVFVAGKDIFRFREAFGEPHIDRS